jgi:RHS repeat-associated protein
MSMTNRTIKNIAFLLPLLVVSTSLSAQVIPTSGQNYIVKRTPRVGTTSVAELQNLPAAKQGAVIEYYDGLGRPLQTVGVAATPDPKSANALDLITPHVYDGMGREYRQLLPYATGGSGAYQPNAVDAGYSAGCDHYKFYNPAVPNGIAPDTRPFGETVYDGSPLSRVVSQTGPGSRWQSHPVGTAYGTNAAGEVTLWTVNDAGALVNSSTYGAGTLYRAAVTDEDGGVAVEYKDFEGRVVRKVADSTGVKATTDYVYDDFGRLRWVLPPKITKGTGTPTTTDLNALAYRYKYDGYGRMIEKKLPGVDSVGMVYDGRDRLVAIQDGVLRKSGRWLYTRYDALNRPVETGYLTNGVQRQDSMQLRVNKAFTGSPQYDTPSGNEYARNSFPRVVGGVSKDGTVSALTYTFYDSYDNGTPLAYDAAKAYSQTRAINVTGLPTVSRVKELTTHTWSTTATYYDEKGRVIQTVKKGLYPDPNGTMTVSTELNFVGQPTRVKEEQFFKPSATASAIATSIERRYDYFDSGQLRGVYAKLNNAAAEEVLATYTYDSLGRVQQKVYGGTAQKQRYKYNIRGWLTDINNPASTSATDYFAMKLGYDTPEVAGAGVVGQYGGSISSMVWRTKMVDGTQNKKGYGFAYDGLDRLKGSSYATGENLSASGAYTEKSLLYDENGNIKSLTRTNGASTATVYSYTYQNNNNSNQLLNVTGGLENYEYDANGNATKDGNKGFRIFYNELNLPQAVAKGTEYVSYVYDATGAKLAMDMSKINNTARYYHGSMVYAKDTNKTTQKAEYKIDYVLHEEGTIKVTTSGSSTTYAYQYNLKDHLGNTRAMFSKAAGAGQTPVLAQATDYYPFGKSFEQNNVDKNRYLYNGKELQDQVIGGTPFGWYDYGARFYDPELGRWHSADPACEEGGQESWTQYHYVFNNPNNNTDPDGRNPLLGAALGAITEYVSIIGEKMLFDEMTFGEANSSLKRGDFSDIGIAGLSGAITGAFDGGVTNFAKKLADPKFQKIVGYLLEGGVSALEDILKSQFKGEEFDLKATLYSTLASMGMGRLLRKGDSEKAADLAQNNANAANKRAKDLAGRKNTNQKLVDKAKQDAKSSQNAANRNTASAASKEAAAKTAANATNRDDKKKKEKKS